MFDDADFECLRADQTARFPLTELHIPRGNPECVMLVVRHAGESNDGWMRGIKNAKFRGLSDDAANRLADELAAKHVIVGWENVLDKQGALLAYVPSAGIELLTKLREMKRGALISRLTGFAADASNFTASVLDAGDLGNG
jgi:hypothetical protein